MEFLLVSPHPHGIPQGLLLFEVVDFDDIGGGGWVVMCGHVNRFILKGKLRVKVLKVLNQKLMIKLGDVVVVLN
jgi:hypothetical protein